MPHPVSGDGSQDKGATALSSTKKRNIIVIFIITLILVLVALLTSVIKTGAYNKEAHQGIFTGDSLFRIEDDTSRDLSVRIQPRSSTWTKIIDLEGEGLEDPNFQAYTMDFYISNNTGDQVSDYSFVLTFDHEVFLMSAWNGSLEIHQNSGGTEKVATIPDLRDFDPADYDLDIVDVGGDILVHMLPGDHIVYIPSSSENAMETPIEANHGVVPGIIFYAPLGEDISGSVLQIDYTFHRELKGETLFMSSLGALSLWFIALLTFVVIEMQIRKYRVQHEHDNDMIKESIETFTGFIDAKDPYTNGHSNRVAEYTRMIAEEMGYDGEELDRIFYIALLHDCGKIGVPDSILCKPGKLTEEEFETIKSHTTRGSEILHAFKSLDDVDEGALYHHERYDGKGYPEGKKGEDIPLIARMICVADSFDAMNSNRVYRKRLTKEAIIEEIETNKGTQFDPNIADILLKLIRSGKIDMSQGSEKE